MVYCFCPAHIEKAAKLGINVDKVREVMFETLYASPANPNRFFDAYAAGEPDVAAGLRCARTRYERRRPACALWPSRLTPTSSSLRA